MAFDVCPWWLGYALVNPLRRLVNPPELYFGPWLSAGMTALDVGPGMGFFTVPMAERVGPAGRVIAVDLQPRMLEGLRRRAARRGVEGVVETRICEKTTLKVDDLAGRVDLALAVAMVHEVPDGARLWSELASTLAPRGRLLFSEPQGHVSIRAFEASIGLAEQAGLQVLERPRVRGGGELVALLGRRTS